MISNPLITIVFAHVARHQLYEAMALDKLVLELLRQMKEKRQMQTLTGAAQAVTRLRRYQVGQMFARVHTAPTQSTYLLAQLWRIPRLTYVNEQLAKLCHMTVDLHDELQE